MIRLRRRAATRPMAVRATLTAVTVALLASAVATAAFTAALRESVGSGLITFATFGSLATLTAGVLAWELASNRFCPRCRREGGRGAAQCASCGYDLRARPRFACSEGHPVAYEPGLCGCGRRLLQLRPVPIARHVLAVLWVGLALAAALLLTALLLTVTA